MYSLFNDHKILFTKLAKNVKVTQINNKKTQFTFFLLTTEVLSKCFEIRLTSLMAISNLFVSIILISSISQESIFTQYKKCDYDSQSYFEQFILVSCEYLDSELQCFFYTEILYLQKFMQTNICKWIKAGK